MNKKARARALKLKKKKEKGIRQSAKRRAKEAKNNKPMSLEEMERIISRL